MAKHSDPTILAFVRYATLSDVSLACRSEVPVFVRNVVVFTLLMGLSAIAPSTNSWSQNIPGWMLWVALASVSLWLWQGTVVKIPNVTAAEWALLTATAFTCSAVGKFWPWWVAAPWMAFVFSAANVLEQVNRDGQRRRQVAERLLV